MTRQEYKQLNEQEQRETKIDLIIGIVSLAVMLCGIIGLIIAAKGLLTSLQ